MKSGKDWIAVVEYYVIRLTGLALLLITVYQLITWKLYSAGIHGLHR